MISNFYWKWQTPSDTLGISYSLNKWENQIWEFREMYALRFSIIKLCHLWWLIQCLNVNIHNILLPDTICSGEVCRDRLYFRFPISVLYLNLHLLVLGRKSPMYEKEKSPIYEKVTVELAMWDRHFIRCNWKVCFFFFFFSPVRWV